MKLHSGQLRMSQVFFSTLNFGSSNGIYNTVLHYNIGRVMAIVDCIDGKNYVNNINYKYTVTMAMTPPTVNMADTLHALNVHFARGRK